MPTPITTELLLDRIAESIITSEDFTWTPERVQQNQKTIRDGIIAIGRTNADNILLYQSDIKANSEDFRDVNDSSTTLTNIVNHLNEAGAIMEQLQVVVQRLNNNVTDISLQWWNGQDPNPTFNLTNLLYNQTSDGTITNPMNVSQFVNLQQEQTAVNEEQANEYLDTNIYELLPDVSLRQEQIDKAFLDIRKLLPPEPVFTEPIQRDVDGNWVNSNQYYYDNSISAPQDNPNYEGNIINEEDAYITRLSDNSSNLNSSKTIEDLRNELNNYLKDIDEPPPELEDERPEYNNQSEGYIKFRNLNQGIIIRNTNSTYVEGLDPNNPSYLNSDGGFTITMWVRFLDKTSEGTLFNFGNPTRMENPFGFKLETYVISPEEKAILETEANYSNNIGPDNPNGILFTDTDTERFVRLIVYDNINNIRYDSHVGSTHFPKLNILPEMDSGVGDRLGVLNNVRIPKNFREWYFICATFNNSMVEDLSTYNDYLYDTNFWMNHLVPGSVLDSLVSNSGYGNKCKVEIISRTDLLRARGYKV